MHRIVPGDLQCMPAPRGRTNRSLTRQTLHIRADGRMSHFHQAAWANGDDARPAAGGDRTKVSSFDVRHDTMPVAVGVLPPLHEIGEVKETHASQRPNVRIVIWSHPGAPPFGIENRRVRQNLLIASNRFEALRRGRMPKAAMQGSQTIFSEFHGIQFQTPVAAKGTRPNRARIRPPGDQRRGRARAPVSHAGLSLNRAYRQPSNRDKFATSLPSSAAHSPGTD